MFVGSFDPEDYNGFQSQVAYVVSAFQAAGVTQLLIDLTNNGGRHSKSWVSCYREFIFRAGGYVCLGEFLHTYLAGANFGFPWEQLHRL